LDTSLQALEQDPSRATSVASRTTGNKPYVPLRDRREARRGLLATLITSDCWPTDFNEFDLAAASPNFASGQTKLPKAEHDTAEWQAAMEALLLVAEQGGPPMFARIGIMRALNRGHVREFNSSRKDTHWGKRKLIRDL
jgi:hypothetical protein